MSVAAPQEDTRLGLGTWMIALLSLYATALYGSAVTVAGAVLPQIQGDLSASLDQMSWIVTASVVAGAIGTPPTPWLSSRFGRKTMLLVCIGGLTVTSVLIGTATNLGEMVLWRVSQALLGAPVIVLTQAMMLDAFPSSHRGLGLSIWTIGISGGWVLGPTFGTLIVEWSNWRVAFLVYAPLGAIGFALCASILPRHEKNATLTFDWLGFVALSIALAGIQLILNRGQRLDWFESPEILAACFVVVIAAYFFVAHSLTTGNPFIDWRVFRDRNLAIGIIIMSMYAYISLAPLILIPTMLQYLRGYELVTIGLLLVPRGVAQILATVVMGGIIDRIQPRVLIALGLLGFGASCALMAQFNLDIVAADLMFPTILQGISMAFITVPAMSVAYATVEPQLRTDAATLVGLAYTLASSAGVAISVLVLTRTSQTNMEEFAGHVVPDNELLRYPEYALSWDLSRLDNLAAIHGEIGQQAMMVGYVNVYWMMAAMCVVVFPLVFLIGKRQS